MRAYKGTVIAIAVVLSACGKNEASGVYVLANDREVALVQIIEDADHKLTGRIQTTAIGPDGVVKENSSTFDGSVSGNSLLLRPSSVWLGGLQASGTYDRDGISLTGQGFTFTAERSSLEKHQEEVGHLRGIASDRRLKIEHAAADQQEAKAQLQQQAQQQAVAEQEAGKASRVQDAVSQLEAIAARLNRGMDHTPDFGKAVAANTARIERMVKASSSMSDFQRGRLRAQANQVIVGSNQIEYQRDQLAVSGSDLIADAQSVAADAGRICGATPTGQLVQPCNAARAAAQKARAAKERFDTTVVPYEGRVKAEIEKQEALAARIDG